MARIIAHVRGDNANKLKDIAKYLGLPQPPQDLDIDAFYIEVLREIALIVGKKRIVGPDGKIA